MLSASEFDDFSHTELFLRALWLVEYCLLDRGTKGLTIKQTLIVRMQALDIGDERTIRRRIRQLFDDHEPSLADNVRWLCERLFRMQQGLPRLCEDRLSRRVAYLIDLDALACLHPSLVLPRHDELDWGSIPLSLDSNASTLLQQGSIDTHIHLGGALSPLFYWIALMSGSLPLDALRAIPSVIRGHAKPRAWQLAIARAMCLRLELACVVRKAQQQRLLDGPVLDCELNEDALNEECCSAADYRDVALAACATERRKPARADDLWPLCDPLRVPASAKQYRHYAEGERRLLVCLGRYLYSHAIPHSKRLSVGQQLLDYLRTRNAFYQTLSHDYGSEGLSRFVETFGRRGFVGGRRASSRTPRHRRRRRIWRQLEESRMLAALNAQLHQPFQGQNADAPLRSIEMRVSLPADNQLMRTLRAWFKGIQTYIYLSERSRKLKIGLIFHFIKFAQQQKAQNQAELAVRRLYSVLHDYPRLRPFIVGIDAAGDERNCPPRVFANAFREMREKANFYRHAPRQEPITLGYTYHVGEDVDDLLTGLRHLGEVVRLLLDNDKGRLGHALALGQAPEQFYQKRAYETEVSRGEHLLDLIWAWGMFSDERHTADTSWLWRRIKNLCQQWDIAESKITKLYKAMLTEPCTDRQILLDEATADARLFERYITIQIDHSWLEMTKQLQQILRQKIARLPICIEANPTSNLIIAKYPSYGALPYKTLVNEGIALSLNTDDPGIFITSLPGEFAMMHNALLNEHDMPHREVMDWLRDRINDAKDSTFLGRNTPVISTAIRSKKSKSLDKLFRYAPE